MGFTVLAEGLLTTGAVAAPQPVLLSASQSRGHVVVTYSVGHLAPGDLVVATSSRRNRVGALVAGVKLRERIRLTSNWGRRRWSSRHTLRRGVYFVQVSGIQTDGVIDCVPPLVNCGERWSNVRRIVVR